MFLIFSHHPDILLDHVVLIAIRHVLLDSPSLRINELSLALWQGHGIVIQLIPILLLNRRTTDQVVMFIRVVAIIDLFSNVVLICFKYLLMS